jgi:hypothetical protein
MAIEIKTEKIVRNDGTLCRKLADVKMIQSNKLPEIYMESKKPVVFKGLVHNKVFCRNTEGRENYEIGGTYTDDEIQTLIDHCRAAGDNLMECNRILAEKKANWHGEETFII